MCYGDDYIELLSKLGVDVGSDPGFSESDITHCEQAHDYQIPIALREYYQRVGKLAFNYAFHVLQKPDALQIKNDRLEFLVESQGTLIWGLPATDDPDPCVVEGISIEGPVGDTNGRLQISAVLFSSKQ